MKHTEDFLKSLGFPSLEIHSTFTHFDFSCPGRRVLLIGPMGSGKTEFAARVWRDAEIAKTKSDAVAHLTCTDKADRRNVFFIKNVLDSKRFTDNPEDALSYRGGFVRCGDSTAGIRNSFDLEKVLEENPEVGTFIIDEASFFDERIAYVIRNYSLEKGAMFIFPTLILNFRRELFNSTARLILDMATDVIPLTAYCEHNDCLESAFYTYRYYTIKGKECPALYFDPLVIVGGDEEKSGSDYPNYQARCDKHHFLPGKEYTFYTLKPLGEKAAAGDLKPLKKELDFLNNNIKKSELCENLLSIYKGTEHEKTYMNALKPDYTAEKALLYLFNEQNLISMDTLVKLVSSLNLDNAYMSRILAGTGKAVDFGQPLLF